MSEAEHLVDIVEIARRIFREKIDETSVNISEPLVPPPNGLSSSLFTTISRLFAECTLLAELQSRGFAIRGSSPSLIRHMNVLEQVCRESLFSLPIEIKSQIAKVIHFHTSAITFLASTLITRRSKRRYFGWGRTFPTPTFEPLANKRGKCAVFPQTRKLSFLPFLVHQASDCLIILMFCHTEITQQAWRELCPLLSTSYSIFTYLLIHFFRYHQSVLIYH